MQSSKICGVAGALGVCASLAGAQSINYGNFMSPRFNFLQVIESSGTDPVPLFGAPSLSGDALLWSPTNFGSSSTAGLGGLVNDTTDGQLTFSIAAKPGEFVSSFTFSERGDYTLDFFGAGFARATVGCAVEVRVTEVNGAPLAPPMVKTFNLLFSPPGSGIPNPNGGRYETPADVGTTIIWNGTGGLDISGFLVMNGINGLATRVDISLDNALTTLASNGATATIRKKQIEGITISVLPAPGSLALLGLGGLVALRRRR